MAFIDRAGMFAPNTQQFAGLGRGIGAGVNQLAKNRLYDQMKNRYLQGANERAQMQALSSMNLQQAPEEGTQDYAIFQQMMNSKMAQPNMQGEVGRAAMALDPAKGLQYMLQEQQAASGSGGKAKAEAILQTPEGKAAIQQLTNAANAVLQAGAEHSEAPTAMTERVLNEAGQNLINARGNFVGVTGEKPEDVIPSQSQLNNLIKLAGDVANQTGNVQNRKFEVTKDINSIADKAITTGKARLNQMFKWTEEYAKLAQQIKGVVEGFKNNPESAQIMAQAAKTIGLAVEPNLQVTTEEVALYSGDNWATKLIEVIPTAARAVRGFTKAEAKKLAEAAKAAGKANPFVTWAMLTQASEAINRGMQVASENTQNITEGVVESGLSAADFLAQGAGALVTPEQKAQIPQLIRSRIGNELRAPSKKLAQAPLSINDPYPESLRSQHSEDWDKDGDAKEDDVLAAALARKKALAEAAEKEAAGKTSTTTSGVVNKSAQEVADKAMTDMILNAFKKRDEQQ